MTWMRTFKQPTWGRQGALACKPPLWASENPRVFWLKAWFQYIHTKEVKNFAAYKSQEGVVVGVNNEPGAPSQIKSKQEIESWIASMYYFYKVFGMEVTNFSQAQP